MKQPNEAILAALRASLIDSVRPKYLGTRNTPAVLGGGTWRWARARAREWHVPTYIVAKKTFIDADAFFAALEAHAPKEEPAAPSYEDELAEARERIRRAG